MADIRTTGVLDDFQRPNEDPLSAGGMWANSGITADPLRLNNHRADLRAGRSLGGSYWLGGPYSGDVEIWANPAGGGAGGIAWGLDLLKQPGATATVDGYRFRQERSNSGPGISIYRVTNGTRTKIASGLIPGFSSGTTGRLMYARKIHATNTCEMWYTTDFGANWTLVATVVSATHVDPFYLGLSLSDNSGSGILGFAPPFGGGIPVTWRPQMWRTPTQHS